jgi:hypothetical protein
MQRERVDLSSIFESKDRLIGDLFKGLNISEKALSLKEKQEIHILIEGCLEDLSQPERTRSKNHERDLAIFKSWYELDGQERLTLKQLGQRYGISTGTARAKVVHMRLDLVNTYLKKRHSFG